ncbi:biotin protein ligase [Metarhizium album ARSEF 1941]|uniref:Biotin protein ligase n=1 Tax=Metarhizium album (strain ARSEF 1941) TaxID=1081103 RepID=A0A0B2WMR5_METAS|nr:biotin protein ligase [Metarhizium album ARSEF 1941]KHN94757.1 biotin protein ligase [Metarhizium album ARSEF 1941]
MPTPAHGGMERRGPFAVCPSPLVLSLSLSVCLSLVLVSSVFVSAPSLPTPTALIPPGHRRLHSIRRGRASTPSTPSAVTNITSPTLPSSIMPRPRALVYRGPASSHGLPEAVAKLLESSPRRFDVQYAGPSEAIQVSPESLSKVDFSLATRSLACSPWPDASPALARSKFQQEQERERELHHDAATRRNTNATARLTRRADLDDAWAETKAFAPAIRNFVAHGGRYLGFCLGAYLAGHTPGFGLLPRGADTDAESDQRGAQVTGAADSIIQVDWTFATGPRAGQRAPRRWVYFQEGAVIKGLREGDTALVLGRYSQGGRVAASLTKYGDGWVGLVGPHPEATLEWFALENLDCPHGEQFDIGHDLIEATMLGGPSASVPKS